MGVKRCPGVVTARLPLQEPLRTMAAPSSSTNGLVVLLVGGIPDSFDDAKLNDFVMTKAGSTPVWGQIERSKSDGSSRGFGFCAFADMPTADDRIAYEGVAAAQTSKAAMSDSRFRLSISVNRRLLVHARGWVPG